MAIFIRLIFSLLWFPTAYTRTDGPMANGCSYAPNDEDVVKQEPFRIPPSDPANVGSAVWYNGNNRIFKMKIVREKSIPLSVFTLRDLKVLEVTKTCFEPCNQYTIPSNITCLSSSLIELRIRHTTITHLPWQIGNLRGLQVLELSHTGLRSLPASIVHLSSLNILYLPNNHLEDLPKQMKSLQSLKQFTVFNNPNLRSIQAINGLTNLTTVDAQNCAIEQIPRHLPQLTDLYLSQNSLTDLTGIAELGQGTKSAKSFYFDRNRIKQLPSGFNRVHNLKKIKLDYNCLKYLSDEIYKIPTLEFLDIEFNQIKDQYMDIYVPKFRRINPKLTIRYKNQHNAYHCKI